MPYKIAEKDGAFCVVKESGENVKCHPTKEKATAHLRALYANVHDSMFPEFSMAITKANITNGVMRWRSVNSDIEADYYGERMSKELFKDFISHIQNNEEIPMPFKSAICEEDWCGGMPYVSIAHYKSGAGMKNVPGEPEKIYLDGDALKSTGVMYDTPLGKAVFKSLQKDLVEKRDDKIRVSIGFLDLEHSHGDKFTFARRALTDKCPLCAKGVGDKIYKKGHLVHLALTRVPANPRTDLQAVDAIEVEKSMTTKREDAESIIEDKAIIEELDLKSMADDVLVIKSEDEDADDKADGKKKKKDGEEDMYEKSVAEPVAENSVVSPSEPAVLASTTDLRGYKEITPVAEQTPVEASLTAFLGRIIAIKSQGLMGEDALKAIQPDFDNIGEVIKAEFTPAPSPAEVEKANLETTLRSILGAVLDEKFQQFSTQTVAPIQAELETLKGELRAKSLTEVPVKKEEIATVQRSLNPVLVQKAKETVQKSSFDLIAQRSVGLQ